MPRPAQSPVATSILSNPTPRPRITAAPACRQTPIQLQRPALSADLGLTTPLTSPLHSTSVSTSAATPHGSTAYARALTRNSRLLHRLTVRHSACTKSSPSDSQPNQLAYCSRLAPSCHLSRAICRKVYHTLPRVVPFSTRLHQQSSNQRLTPKYTQLSPHSSLASCSASVLQPCLDTGSLRFNSSRQRSVHR